jgi:hypothetical protein
MRIDPEKLNISLPPEQFQAATTETMPPVISATYSSKQWEDMIRARQHQFGLNLEHINRAAMSGSKRLTDAMVQKANAFTSAYAEKVAKDHPIQSAQPLPGAGRSTSLKMATEKKMMGE